MDNFQGLAGKWGHIWGKGDSGAEELVGNKGEIDSVWGVWAEQTSPWVPSGPLIKILIPTPTPAVNSYKRKPTGISSLAYFWLGLSTSAENCGQRWAWAWCPT